MLLSQKQLINLPVRAKNGQKLGRVKNFTVSVEDLKIQQITVAKSKILSQILADELIIGATQIVEITEKEIIVQDNTVETFAATEQTAAA